MSTTLTTACARALANASIDDFLDQDAEDVLVTEIVLAAHTEGRALDFHAVRRALRDQARAEGLQLTDE